MNRKKYATFFSGKKCIVTGASTGIGYNLSKSLYALGAHVILISRREQELENALEAIQRTHPSQDNTIQYFVADLSTEQGGEELYAYATKVFSNEIDILVANAGASMHAKVSESSKIIYELMLSSNYFTLVNFVLPFLPYIEHNPRKKKVQLVSVTSIQSLIGVPYHAAYVASKHAAAGFLESLELEEAENLDIIEIIPGWVSGTKIRESALDGYGNKVKGREGHKRHSRSSVTVEECVDAMLWGMYKNKRLVFRPKFWRHILFVKYSMRSYLHWLIRGRQQFSSS